MAATGTVTNLREEASFWRTYLFSTDHKTIAKQYLSLGLFWAVAGGFLAYLMRWQLAFPDTEAPGWGHIAPDFYNMVVTMHGTIMVFFVAMPILLAAFGNFLIPLLIGARDMAFPRLNMLSFWVFALASSVLLISFFVPGGAASAGWTGYPPLSAKAVYTGVDWGINLWILALALEFVSFLMGGINFLPDDHDQPASPGDELLPPSHDRVDADDRRCSLPALRRAADRRCRHAARRPRARNHVFPARGRGRAASLATSLLVLRPPPEVYVILLPGLGITLEVLSVFARKPIFGYRTVIVSTIVAGALSFVVWAHHQFLSGMDPRLAMPLLSSPRRRSRPYSSCSTSCT